VYCDVCQQVHLCQGNLNNGSGTIVCDCMNEMNRGAAVVGRWMLPAGSGQRGTLYRDDVSPRRSVLVVLGRKLYRLDEEGRLYLLSTCGSDIHAIAHENGHNFWMAVENGTCVKDSIKSRPEQVSTRLLTSGSATPSQSKRVRRNPRPFP